MDDIRLKIVRIDYELARIEVMFLSGEYKGMEGLYFNLRNILRADLEKHEQALKDAA